MLQHNKIAAKWHFTVNDSLPVTMRLVRSPRCEPRIVCKHSPPQVCALYHFVGNWNWSQKKGAERPSSLRGATLQAIHHLAAACLSSFPLCLSPTLSLSSAPLFLSKKNPLLPSKNPSSFCPPSSSAAVSRSLPNPGGEKLRFCYGVWVSDLSIASNPA